VNHGAMAKAPVQSPISTKRVQYLRKSPERVGHRGGGFSKTCLCKFLSSQSEVLFDFPTISSEESTRNREEGGPNRDQKKRKGQV
jgi:hypothetical protein